MGKYYLNGGKTKKRRFRMGKYARLYKRLEEQGRIINSGTLCEDSLSVKPNWNMDLEMKEYDCDGHSVTQYRIFGQPIYYEFTEYSHRPPRRRNYWDNLIITSQVARKLNETWGRAKTWMSHQHMTLVSGYPSVITVGNTRISLTVEADVDDPQIYEITKKSGEYRGIYFNLEYAHSGYVFTRKKEAIKFLKKNEIMRKVFALYLLQITDLNFIRNADIFRPAYFTDFYIDLEKVSETSDTKRIPLLLCRVAYKFPIQFPNRVYIGIHNREQGQIAVNPPILTDESFDGILNHKMATVPMGYSDGIVSVLFPEKFFKRIRRKEPELPNNLFYPLFIADTFFGRYVQFLISTIIIQNSKKKLVIDDLQKGHTYIDYFGIHRLVRHTHYIDILDSHNNG